MLVTRNAVLAVILLAGAGLAHASNYAFTFSGGSFGSSGPADFVLSTGPGGTTLNSALWSGSLITGTNLGSVIIRTGSLLSGSLQTGGILAAGGQFTITANGAGGLPAGILFDGGFRGPVTWTVLTNGTGANMTYTYTLSGPINGQWYGHGQVFGATVTLTFSSRQPFNGSVGISGGSISINVPEPGTLALMGTGMAGIAAGAVKRRLGM